MPAQKNRFCVSTGNIDVIETCKPLREILTGSATDYEVIGYGASFSTGSGKRVFNRGIKRGKTILVTGDKPRFALMGNFDIPEQSIEPDLIKMGDGRIRVKYAAFEEWLDEAPDIFTVFNPGNTEYKVTFPSLPCIDFHLLVFQAEDWGIVAKLSLINNSNIAMDIVIDLIYGGLSRHGRTYNAEYFKSDSDKITGNIIDISENHAVFSDDKIPARAMVLSFPEQKPVIDDLKVRYSHNIELEVGETKVVYLIAGHNCIKENIEDKLRTADLEKLVLESEYYYDNLLLKSTISTPSDILNSGFRTAVINLEYTYAEPAWLEGIHWWSAYHSNNYQISAAISLNQIERAKKALEMYGFSERGLCPIFCADSKPRDYDGYNDEDGLPYYLYELFQYADHTGDDELIEKLWPKINDSLDRLWQVRDSNGNKLLDWHIYCNAFLYQADHLGMPGDAASPSLMIAGILEKVSIVSERLGKLDDGIKWKNISDVMYLKLIELLWNRNEGVFYNHMDLQGIKHICHYYTDLVFPTLYTSLPGEYGWQSLEYLNRTLWLKNVIGELSLMRVGDLKPTIFGNDNVMPVQMAETARAYFKVGEFNRGIKLLESVALAATIFTDAPGNFPERMSDEGKGEANYIFGNPIGSFIYSVIGGLFGLSLVNGGTTLAWEPAFPDDWDHADIGLTYAKAAYKSFSNSSMKTNIYSIENDKTRNLNFSVQLESCKVKTVLHNGKPVDYTVHAGPGRIKVGICVESSISHKVQIEYMPMSISFTGPAVIESGANARWEFSSPVEMVSDPQDSLHEVVIDGNVIEGLAGNKFGYHQIFAALKDLPVIQPIAFEIKPCYKVLCENAVYDAEKKSVNLGIRVTSPAAVAMDAKLLAKIMEHDGNASLVWAGCGEAVITVEISGVEMLPEGIYEAECTIEVKGETVYKETVTVNLKGKDSKTDTLMCELRDRKTDAMDISRFYNTSSVYAISAWRGQRIEIDCPSLTGDSAVLKTVAGSFKLPGKGPCLAMVEYGTSHAYTRETMLSDKPDSITIPIGKKTMMISLLYASEIESRLTYSQVGSLRLKYNNKKITYIPLIVGKNIDSLYSHFAKETIPVDIGSGDYINVLRLSCDHEFILEDMEIQLIAADTQFGLMGVNLVL